MNERGNTDIAFTTVKNNLTVEQSDTCGFGYYNRTASAVVIIFCCIAMSIQINWLFLSYKGKRLHIRENTFHFVQVFVHICGILKELIIGILVALDFNECNLPGAFTWRKYLPFCRLSMKYLCLIGIVRMMKITQPYIRIPWWVICVMSVIVWLYCGILVIIPDNKDLVWVDNVADICCFGLTVIVHSKMLWSLKKKIFTVHVQPNVITRQNQLSMQASVNTFQIRKLNNTRGRQTELNISNDHMTSNIPKIAWDIRQSNIPTDASNICKLGRQIESIPADASNVRQLENVHGHQTESNIPVHTQTDIVDTFQIHVDLSESENNEPDAKELPNEEPQMHKIISDIGVTFNSFVKVNAKQGLNKTYSRNGNETLDCQKVNKWNKISPAKSPVKVFTVSNPGREHHQNQQPHLSIAHPSRRKDLKWEYKLIASEVVVLVLVTLFHMVVQITFRMNDCQLFHLLYSIFVLCLYSIIQCLTLLTSRALRHEFVKIYFRKNLREESEGVNGS
ncbi:unnamed protein product [Owenia fusiformis]|uniref:Uncharacterized protein n=1 Tax=Owenia fusiformis TaxID=6347 RepID=A0A8S4N326_OWEFU|nr:unnamed protein product [Owenia fusiformis]